MTLLLLLAVSTSFSQEIGITKSEIFKDKKKNSELSFSLEDDDGGIVTIRQYYGGMIQKLKGYYIQYFDNNLKLIKDFDYEVENNAIKNAFLKDGKLHLIEMENHTKDNLITMSVVSADLKDFEFSSKQLLSFDEDNIKKYFGIGIGLFWFDNGYDQEDGDHLGEVIISANEKFFAINFDIKNKEQETHKVFVFNDKFEQVYEKLIVKDIKDKLFKYNSFEVDGTDGTIYFLGKSYENNTRKAKKNGEVNYHFELNKINAESEQTISFRSDDHFIESLSLVRNNTRLAAVGFYGAKGENRLNGVCVFDLNPDDLSFNYKKYNAFSDEFLTDKYGNREGKKERQAEKGIANIDFKGVYLMANNDILINTEEFFITTHTSMGANGSMHTYTVYHFNDIMAMRVDANGNLLWARNINKAQTSLLNSSFTTLPVENSTYFFINCSDNVKKLSGDRISFKQTKSKKSNLYVISIDQNGQFDYKKLIDDKDSKVYYKVRNGVVNLNQQTAFFLGERKKEGQILKLKAL